MSRSRDTATRARGTVPRSPAFRRVMQTHSRRDASMFGVPVSDMTESEARAMLVWAADYVVKMRRAIEGVLP